MGETFAGIIGNLAYEFLGVFLPGLIASVFVLLFWIALGPAVPYWTFGVLPQFSASILADILDSLSPVSGVSVVIPLLVLWYFAGHLLLWWGRIMVSNKKEPDVWWKQITWCLVFRMPRYSDNFDPTLQALVDSLKADFSAGKADLPWRQFYPVAKSYLAQHVGRSLVSVYQNKYTLHRSVVCASVILFWFSIISVLLTSTLVLLGHTGAETPNPAPLTLLIVGSLLLIWAFSNSFAYHWKMFGNTIVTELYSLLRGPKLDRDQP